MYMYKIVDTQVEQVNGLYKNRISREYLWYSSSDIRDVAGESDYLWNINAVSRDNSLMIAIYDLVEPV